MNTMTREQAQALNPLIGDDWEKTVDQAVALAEQVAAMLRVDEDAPPLLGMRVLEFIHMALNFERTGDSG